MYSDIAEAVARQSLCDLVYLAWTYWWADKRAPDHDVPSPGLTEVNNGLLKVISGLANTSRYPYSAAVAPTVMVIDVPRDSRVLYDLVLTLKMPDSPELRPAVGAAAESLLARGSDGRHLLLAHALSASGVMRLRVAALFEQAGDPKAARRLRKGLKGTVLR
jgi:hypothetical protein